MKILLITLVLISFGCTSQKRCIRKFPPETFTIVKDSIREIVTFRDTTIYIKLDPITITKTDTIYIKNGVTLFKQVNAETNLATAKAWIGQNRINLTLADKDTTIIITLKNALKSRDFWLQKWSSEKQVINVPYTPKFWKVTGWIGMISILLIIAYFTLKIIFRR
jgi:hypothetical protein